MEVIMPLSPPTNFNFDSTTTSPYTTAPSTPHRLPTFFYSAPTSPTTRLSPVPSSTVPFHWEEKPGIPKAKESHIGTATSSNYGDDNVEQEDLEDIDFAFDFSGHLEKCSLSADELFDGGKIKPLKPPPRFGYDYYSNKSLDSPKSPKSPKVFIKEAFSPRHRKRDFDPFTKALEQTRKENFNKRERTRTRSLSPLRVSDLLLEPGSESQPSKNSSFASFWYKKWKIKDLLLFRSASESRATDDKDQLKKYSILKKTRENDVKNSSFRSTDSVGSVSSRTRSRPSISAHELHYTAKRAVSEEMKRRTFLPYKQGLLGCLGFHKTVSEISRGIGSSSMSR